jgi:outer membrane lipase/esterase
VQIFDYFSFFNNLVSDPEDFGLPADLIVDPTRYCLAEVAPSPNINCSQYLSFDGIHVTTGVQRAIAWQVSDQLMLGGAVPEPASWGLMIAGFGAVGFALRRRRALLAA